MADNLVNKDAIIRFLAGYEEDLAGRPIDNGTVYFALKPDPSKPSNTVGSIYIDANDKRLIMVGDGVAITDIHGHAINEKYIQSISFDGVGEDNGKEVILTYVKGNQADVEVKVPNASETSAGSMTTKEQRFAGRKIFTGGVEFTNADFIYSGIQSNTTSENTVVLFADVNSKGTPVYNEGFIYNAKDNALTVGAIHGVADDAIADNHGNNIYEFYLKDIESDYDFADEFHFWGIKGNEADATVNIIPKANLSHAGLMSTNEQLFKGIKTFTDDIILGKEGSRAQAKITRNGLSSGYANGSLIAALRIDSYTATQKDTYSPVISAKTKNGDWTYGVYNDDSILWVYTENNSDPIMSSLDNTGRFTTSSVFAQDNLFIGVADESYNFYNQGTSYLNDELTVDADSKLKRVVITDVATDVKHLEFLGQGANYIAATNADGTFVFLPNGADIGEENGTLIISKHGITPGTDNKYDIGSSDFYWKDGYIYNLFAKNNVDIDNDLTVAGNTNLSGDLHLQGNLTVEGTTNLQSDVEINGVTSLKNQLVSTHGFELAGDIMPTTGDLQQNIGGNEGTDVYGWMFYGRLGSWHPEKTITPSSMNIAAKGDASLSYFLATDSASVGEPQAESHIIHMEWNNTSGYSGQIALPIEDKNGDLSNSLQWRTQNGGGTGNTWKGEWRTILDMQNYDDDDKLETIFVHTAGDIMQGDLQIEKTLTVDEKITTPILFATERVGIGAEDSNYGLYNAYKTFFNDTLTVEADSYLKRVEITNQNDANVKHLAFKNSGYNYITAVGSFAFLPANKDCSEADSRLIIENGGIRPGEDAVYNLGTATKQWKNAYVETLAVSDDVTIGDTLTVTGETFLENNVYIDGSLEVDNPTHLKSELEVDGTSTFKSQVYTLSGIESNGDIWIIKPNAGLYLSDAHTFGISVDGNALCIGISDHIRLDTNGNVSITQGDLTVSNGDVNIPQGILTLQSGVYTDAYTGALNMSNSNIYGVNSIYTADLADNAAEGIHFYRNGSTVDSFWIKNGTMYFTPNRPLGNTSAESFVVIHTGNYGVTADNRYVLKSGDTMTGTLNITASDGSNRSVTAENSAGKVGIHVSTNQGLYDFTNSKWLIYNRDSDNTIRIANRLYTDGGLTANNSIIMDTTAAGYGYYVRNGGVDAGRWYVSTKGTVGDGSARVIGITMLSLGNNTAASTTTTAGAGNARGLLRIYGPGANYVNLYYSGESANYTLYLPEKQGQLVSTNIPATTSKIYVMGTTATGSTSNTLRVYANSSVYCSGSVLYGAAWNDYAEYRQTTEKIEGGRVVVETGRGDLKLSTERLQPGANVVSDTFGFAIGETKKAKTPLAVAGRVLVYTFEDRYSYEPGDAVCTGPNGTVSKMTREELWKYPERIVGTVSEIPEYDIWESGDGPLKVNGRIWIKVK